MLIIVKEVDKTSLSTPVSTIKISKEDNTMRKELLKGLSEEQIAKIHECKTADEILALAKEEGVELTEEQMEAVSGGGLCKSNKCPNCGSKNYAQEWSPL